MEEQKNYAYEYALLIKRELIALETLLENGQAITDDLERARGTSPEMDDETLAECVAAQDELGIEEWPNDYQDIFSTYLNETCLDMTVLRAVNGSDRARIELLRTCGGPRCDIFRDTNDGDMVEIAVHSGGDSSTLRVSVSNVAAALDAIGECY
jgi:hypothetical protein